MRDAFHEDLDTISDQLVEMTRLAGSAMSRATTALLDADIQLAESVIEADKELDRMREDLDALSIDLLARQQPVATDLRMVVTGMRMSADLERMGDLARHVAKVARLRYPESAVPADIRAHDPADGPGGRAHRRQGGLGHRRQGRRGRQDRSSATTTRWTSCTAAVQPPASTARGSTAPRRPST